MANLMSSGHQGHQGPSLQDSQKDRATAANCGVGIEDVKLSMGLEAAMAYLELKIVHLQTNGK